MFITSSLAAYIPGSSLVDSSSLRGGFLQWRSHSGSGSQSHRVIRFGRDIQNHLIPALHGSQKSLWGFWAAWAAPAAQICCYAMLSLQHLSNSCIPNMQSSPHPHAPGNHCAGGKTCSHRTGLLCVFLSSQSADDLIAWENVPFNLLELVISSSLISLYFWLERLKILIYQWHL